MEVVSYNHYVGFFKRFIAFIIDSIIIRLGLTLIFGYFSHFDFNDPFNRNTLVVELLTAAYFVFCESSAWQATIGKKLLGMKVVGESFGRISPGTALLRYISSYLSGFILGLGYIWIIFDSKKQGWHDKIAGTYVIEG